MLHCLLLETWLSGRKYLTANEAGLYRPRGFESRRLRLRFAVAVGVGELRVLTAKLRRDTIFCVLQIYAIQEKLENER